MISNFIFAESYFTKALTYFRETCFSFQLVYVVMDGWMMLISFYFLGASILSSTYLTAFLTDATTPNTDRTSWGMIILASVLWPIVFPISCVDLLYRTFGHKVVSSELQ